MTEIRQQNQQILVQLDQLKSRQEELERLNQELQDTNRGVVALYAELDERADHLRRADELKSKFLSHMSHEFRTPLNSILALSRLLLDRSDGELTERAGDAGPVHSQGGAEPDRAGRRPARSGEGRGRQDGRRAIRVHGRIPVRRAARHAAPAARRRRGRAGVRGGGRAAADRHRRRQGFADSAQLHLERAQVHRAWRGAGVGHGGRRKPTPSPSPCAIPASASSRTTSS